MVDLVRKATGGGINVHSSLGRFIARFSISLGLGGVLVFSSLFWISYSPKYILVVVEEADFSPFSSPPSLFFFFFEDLSKYPQGFFPIVVPVRVELLDFVIILWL